MYAKSALLWGLILGILCFTMPTCTCRDCLVQVTTYGYDTAMCYLPPLFQHVIRQRPCEPREGPIGLILTANLARVRAILQVGTWQSTLCAEMCVLRVCMHAYMPAGLRDVSGLFTSGPVPRPVCAMRKPKRRQDSVGYTARQKTYARCVFVCVCVCVAGCRRRGTGQCIRHRRTGRACGLGL